LQSKPATSSHHRTRQIAVRSDAPHRHGQSQSSFLFCDGPLDTVVIVELAAAPDGLRIVLAAVGWIHASASADTHVRRPLSVPL
jgi:hypothetical protein